MTEIEYIKQLEERVEKLEKIIGNITISEGQIVTFNDCPIGNINASEGCNLSLNDCPIGTVIPTDIGDAEDRIDDLEDRLHNIMDQMDDIDNE